MEMEEIVQVMEERYGTKPASTRTYTSAPMFKRVDGNVSLRTPEDPPYQTELITPIAGNGLFLLNDGRMTKVVRVNHEMRRGSGTALGASAATAIGIRPDQVMTLWLDEGTYPEAEHRHIKVTMPGRSNNGATCSSLKGIAEDCGARNGDLIALTLDTARRLFTYRLVRRRNLYRSWETIGHLTGLGPDCTIADVAASVRSTPSQVREALARRGDHLIAELLPS